MSKNNRFFKPFLALANLLHMDKQDRELRKVEESAPRCIDKSRTRFIRTATSKVPVFVKKNRQIVMPAVETIQ